MYRGVPTYLGATHACYFLFQMCVHPPRIMYVSSFSMPLLYHVICLFSHAWFANWTKTMTMSLQSHTMLPFLFIFLSFGHKLKNQFQKRTQNTTNPDKPMQPKWKDQKIKTICNLFFRVTTKLLHVKRLHVLPLMWTVVATTCLKQPIGVPYPFPYELLVMWLQGPKPLLCLWEKNALICGNFQHPTTLPLGDILLSPRRLLNGVQVPKYHLWRPPREQYLHLFSKSWATVMWPLDLWKHLNVQHSASVPFKLHLPGSFWA